MTNVPDKRCRENQNTHFMFKFFPENRTAYETWKNMAQPDRPQMAMRRMRFAGWIPVLHTHTHTHTRTHTHTHTHTTCNTYCFPTARMITLTRRKITLYVHWLSSVSNTGWWTKSNEWKISPTMYVPSSELHILTLLWYHEKSYVNSTMGSTWPHSKKKTII